MFFGNQIFVILFELETTKLIYSKTSFEDYFSTTVNYKS